MAFVHGKTSAVYVGGYNLSAYFKSASPKASADVADVTCLGASVKSYIAGVKDGTLSVEGVFDGAADVVDEELAAVFGVAGTEVSAYPGGESAVGTAGYGLSAIHNSYSVDAPVDGVVTVSGEFQSSVALERILSLHPLAAETGTGNGSTHNNSAATTDGGAAYLHITAFNGTDVTISINHSTDNFVASDDELCAFTQATAVGSERVAIAAATTVRQYARVVIAGTFTSVTFSVGLYRR